jgi:uncharacterized iron-regulated membrane protein
LLRVAVLLHRYLGITLGVVITLWCVSGIVMMFVPYPSFDDTARAAALTPLDFRDCCAPPDSLAAALDESAGFPIERFSIEMLAGRPVLRVFSLWGQTLVDLTRGQPRPGPSPSELERIAADFAARTGIEKTPSYLGALERDQWTVSGEYAGDRPLHLFAGNDTAGTQWYISDATGEVVLQTTASQRFWNWIGAVTHWIYFTALRERGTLWAQIVIWLATASVVLTLLGLYLGLRRYGRGPTKRWTPYRGWMRWHHLAGLVFGALALTWALSGLLSMNPWGLLEGRSFAAERERLRGAGLDPATIASVVESVTRYALPADTTRVDSSLVGGTLALVARHVGGRERTRLEPERGEESPFDAARFPELAAALRPGIPIVEQGWLDGEDAYYFGNTDRTSYPVYRIIHADGERFYLDRLTGALLYAVDKPRQRYRWWFAALHRGDFAALARVRPLWDLWFLPLLLGVTASAITGTWLGFKRLAGRGSR